MFFWLGAIFSMDDISSALYQMKENKESFFFSMYSYTVELDI